MYFHPPCVQAIQFVLITGPFRFSAVVFLGTGISLISFPNTLLSMHNNSAVHLVQYLLFIWMLCFRRVLLLSTLVVNITRPGGKSRKIPRIVYAVSAIPSYLISFNGSVL